MDRSYLVPPTPVGEAFEGGVTCADCNAHLAQEAYYDGVADHYCERCMTDRTGVAVAEAEQYAREHCRITRPLPRYDSRHEYRCSPDDYAMGDRYSYTPNSHLARCRHDCTNYDDLISGLDRMSVWDEIRYLAIHARIMELVEEAIDAVDGGGDEDDIAAGDE